MRWLWEMLDSGNEEDICCINMEATAVGGSINVTLWCLLRDLVKKEVGNLVDLSAWSF